jgi:hypothetical protein
MIDYAFVIAGAFAVGYFARQRGRSAISWFLLGLLSCPVTFVILLFMRKRQPRALQILRR